MLQVVYLIEFVCFIVLYLFKRIIVAILGAFLNIKISLFLTFYKLSCILISTLIMNDLDSFHGR
jgi:hypothetical protein